MTDDDLLPLLSPRPPAGPDDIARAVAPSRRVIRRRGHRRTATRAAGVLMLTLAAFAAGRLTTPPPEPVMVAVREVVVVTQPPAGPTPDPRPQPPPTEPAPPAEPPPERLELLAELSDDPAEVATLYRRAGDAYLAARADVKQAVRCYRLHLAAAGPDSRAVAASDSWLLSSMKN